MTSKAAKEQRLRASRLKRARALGAIDPRRDPPPPGAVMADHAELAHINTDAVLCRSCRESRKAQKAEARRIHLDGLAKKRAKPQA